MVDHADLQIDVYRSRDASGAGSRAVRVTHLPTGLVGISQGQASEAEDVTAAIAEIEAKLAAPNDPV
jgi:protein subunit release factor A